MNEDIFFKIKDVEKHFPGLNQYRVRQWCKQKKIRFNTAGNRIILRKSWLDEDLNKMAKENITLVESSSSYGVLRKVSSD